jgi:choline dehydrogenase-like flavoprotein
VQANKEVILCAGAFGSPQLLMLSGIGPKQELLKHDIPCRVELPVGEQLMDHVFTLTAAFLKQPAVTTDGSLLDCTGFYKSDWSKEVEPKRGRDMQVFDLVFLFDVFIVFCLGGDVFQSSPSL